jgi:hypothetical protein
MSTETHAESAGVLTGGCLCGQVRYRIAAKPVACRICWCRECQHLASNGTVNMLVGTDAIQVGGEVAAYVSTADSGNQVTRRFCATCGTQLFADTTGRAGLTVVRVGTLEDPSCVHPTGNIWCASAPAWACLDPALASEAGPAAPRP